MRPFFAVALLALASCPTPPPPPAPVWSPGVIYPSEPTTFRGFLDVRGLIHAHSVFSHDACDGEPVDAAGVRDLVCFDDFRRGLCQSKHDFAFLTDHRDAFDDTEFPDALLFREQRGDVLVRHDGKVSANLAACPDERSALIMAGAEAGTMPVGIEGHPVPREQRGDLYGAQTPEAAAILHSAGAVVLLAHPEDFTVDELFAMPVDGFEMYNLHANTLMNAGVALDFILRASDGEPMPHPDLLVASLWSEDVRYLERWGRVLAKGKNVVTTLGTDCHRNAFATLLADGERADSYRRMMIAFSNHLRVRTDGVVDDRALKEALAAGRNWGAFEMLGHPVGYDAFVTAGDEVLEMGAVVPLGATLSVKRPAVQGLDAARQAPAIVLRILRAVDDAAGFVEIARADDGDLAVPLAEAGAHRAEVRMVPYHLREDFNDDANAILQHGRDFVWIYGGTFIVQ